MSRLFWSARMTLPVARRWPTSAAAPGAAVAVVVAAQRLLNVSHVSGCQSRLKLEMERPSSLRLPGLFE